MDTTLFHLIKICYPVSPNINMQVLLTVGHIFPKVLVGRILSETKTFYPCIGDIISFLGMTSSFEQVDQTCWMLDQ